MRRICVDEEQKKAGEELLRFVGVSKGAFSLTMVCRAIGFWNCLNAHLLFFLSFFFLCVSTYVSIYFTHISWILMNSHLQLSDLHCMPSTSLPSLFPFQDMLPDLKEHVLFHASLLTLGEGKTRWLAVPSFSRMAMDILSGRQELLRLLRRSRYK